MCARLPRRYPRSSAYSGTVCFPGYDCYRVVFIGGKLAGRRRKNRPLRMFLRYWGGRNCSYGCHLFLALYERCACYARYRNWHLSLGKVNLW